MKSLLGRCNFPAPRKQPCSRCDRKRTVHSYQGSDPTKPVCEGCATILRMIQKFTFANSHPEARPEEVRRPVGVRRVAMLPPDAEVPVYD